MSKAHCLPIHVIGDADAPQLSADIGQQLRDIFRITQETLVKPGALKAAEHFWRPFYIKAVVSVGTNNHFFYSSVYWVSGIFSLSSALCFWLLDPSWNIWTRTFAILVVSLVISVLMYCFLMEGLKLLNKRFPIPANKLNNCQNDLEYCTGAYI